MNDGKVKEGAKTPKFFYTVKELAGILQVSASCIYTRIEAGDWPCKRVGRRVLIPSSFVDRFIQAA